MRTLRLVYTGCPMGGKRSSLSFLLGLPARGAGEEYEIRTSERYRLLVSVSSLRASLSYEDRLLAEVADRVAPELERLRAADGIIFVVDAQPEMQELNLHAFKMLRDDLEGLGRSLDQIPVVFQINKVDLPDVVPPATLRGHFQTLRSSHVESIATQGNGVREALAEAVSLVTQTE